MLYCVLMWCLQHMITSLITEWSHQYETYKRAEITLRNWKHFITLLYVKSLLCLCVLTTAKYVNVYIYIFIFLLTAPSCFFWSENHADEELNILTSWLMAGIVSHSVSNDVPQLITLLSYESTRIWAILKLLSWDRAWVRFSLLALLCLKSSIKRRWESRAEWLTSILKPHLWLRMKSERDMLDCFTANLSMLAPSAITHDNKGWRRKGS